jgi:hypothetical protein
MEKLNEKKTILSSVLFLLLSDILVLRITVIEANIILAFGILSQLYAIKESDV